MDEQRVREIVREEIEKMTAIETVRIAEEISKPKQPNDKTIRGIPVVAGRPIVTLHQVIDSKAR